jgi:toxin-antitoxin system PIN domain toxin
MRYLLDVNVWVALFDDAHSHSLAANEFVAKRGVKIATCATVENAVVRVMNLPNYGRQGAVGLGAVRDQLQLVCTKLNHEFWPDDVSLRDAKRFDFAKLHSHNQITDAYLLALAVAHKGALVTFDQRIVLSAVVGATAKHLVVLS